jgi:hypothetical protein
VVDLDSFTRRAGIFPSAAAKDAGRRSDLVSTIGPEPMVVMRTDEPIPQETSLHGRVSGTPDPLVQAPEGTWSLFVSLSYPAKTLPERRSIWFSPIPMSVSQ